MPRRGSDGASLEQAVAASWLEVRGRDVLGVRGSVHLPEAIFPSFAKALLKLLERTWWGGEMCTWLQPSGKDGGRG